MSSLGGVDEPTPPQKGPLGSLAIDLQPLRYLDFRRLWMGQGVSFIGFQVTAVAVPIQIYELTKSSLWVGLLGVANFVPLVVFGLWGGAIADAIDRRVLLLVSSLVAWAATWMLLVQALLHLHSAPLLLAITAVQSAGFAVTSPTRSAIIPRLVPASLVPAANTLSFVVSGAGTIAGPLLAALVVNDVGYAGAYGLDAALFTVGLYAAIRLPPIPPLIATNATTPTTASDAADADGVTAARPTVGLRSVVEGIVFISSRPILWMSFVVDLIAMGFGMPRALFPQVAIQRFGGVGAAGWLYAAIAIGAVVGGLASGWVGRVRHQGIACMVAIAAWGVFVALSGLGSTLWLTVVLLAVAGAFDLISSVYRQTILQTYAPDEMRGRLQGVFTVVVAGGPRLGDLRAGIVAALVGARASWIGGGIACVVAIVVTGFLAPSFVRYIPNAPGAPTASDEDRRPPGG
jgi:MFS family permease